MPEYVDDYEHLKKIAEKYKEDGESCLYNPQAYLKRQIGDKWMELVRYFEEKIHLKDNETSEDHEKCV